MLSKSNTMNSKLTERIRRKYKRKEKNLKNINLVQKQGNKLQGAKRARLVKS